MNPPPPFSAAQLPDNPSEFGAHFSSRLRAGFIDWSVCVVLAGALTSLLEASSPIWFVVFPWIYFAALESSPWQATLGKRSTKIIVVGNSGSRLSFYQSSLRYLAKCLVVTTACIGTLTYFFSKRGQMLHDMLTNTFVLNRIQGTTPTKKRAVDAAASPTNAHSDTVGGSSAAPETTLEGNSRSTMDAIRYGLNLVIVLAIVSVFWIVIQEYYDRIDRNDARSVMGLIKSNVQVPYVDYFEQYKKAPPSTVFVVGDPRLKSIEIDSLGSVTVLLAKPEGTSLRLSLDKDKDGNFVGWACEASGTSATKFSSVCR